MCGIAGFIQLGVGRDILAAQLMAMLRPIHHRGPDDGGIWFDDRSDVALGHRRLSVLDLSPAGHQPMESACGRFVIVFNGEIYNHLELRRRLERAELTPEGGWRGHADTETLLASFGVWGVEETLKTTVGMFALALWDKQERSLTLARDRVGEKPLYYGWQHGVFLFGSELKSLRAHPAFNSDLDWGAARTFLHVNYIPTPSTIYQGIYKLVPGTFIRLTQVHVQLRALPTPSPYWSLGEVALKGADHPFAGGFQDAVEELETRIRHAVQLQSVADVPVGAFLSGGIDSSTVVAMMKSATTSQVTTFSIGMPIAEMDESHNAAAVARHLGTNHVEHVVHPKEALDLIPRLPEIWDEPLGDSSQIPTYLVSRLAKQHVTVALSGDGGDELFLGYPQYTFYQKIWRTRHLGKLPWDLAFAVLSPLTTNNRLDPLLRRAKSIVGAWRQPNAQALNRYWMDRYRQSSLPTAHEHGAGMLPYPILQDVASTAGVWDAGTYLPDDILAKVDRASMANSLETRAPLLDHRIIELSLSLPPEFKIAHGHQKRILKEVLYRHVPKILVDRPKMGFSLPMASWLRNELRPWGEHILDAIPADDEFFDKQKVFRLWQDHHNGLRDNTEQLWGIFSLVPYTKYAQTKI